MNSSIAVLLCAFAISGCASSNDRRLADIEYTLQKMQKFDYDISNYLRNNNNQQDTAATRRATDIAVQALEEARAARKITDQIEVIHMPGGGIVRPVRR